MLLVFYWLVLYKALTLYRFCDKFITSVVQGVRTQDGGGSLTSQIITVHVCEILTTKAAPWRQPPLECCLCSKIQLSFTALLSQDTLKYSYIILLPCIQEQFADPSSP